MRYQVEATLLPDIALLTLPWHRDARGFFVESFNRRLFAEAVGQDIDFVQDNHSKSQKNVLRGLHYQTPEPQGKLIRVLVGEIFDVAVDLRQSSPTFGRWCGLILSADLPQLLWLPVGFAHGFLVLSEQAEVFYKTTAYYHKLGEQTLHYADPHLAIAWPLPPGVTPLLSEKDRQAAAWAQVLKFA